MDEPTPEPSPRWRLAKLVAGWALIVVAPITAPLPGPAATFIFAAGLALVLRNSAWARRQFVIAKRRWPRAGAWVDWGLRRASAARRHRRDTELTSQPPSPNAPDDQAARAGGFLH